jgi:lysophospholipase L1-like esterase
MNEVESNFYDVPQAAGVLQVTPEKVLELITRGDLEARRDEESNEWLIEASSVRARLDAGTPSEARGPQSTPEEEPSSVLEGTQQKKPVFDLDLLILLAIGTVTLLAAAYTLLPALLGGGSTQTQEAATASAATGNVQSETTTETAAGDQKTTSATAAPADWVSAVGDSVMLGAIDPLQQEVPKLGLLDAQGSRQPPVAIDVIRRLRAANHLGDAVVVHIGNNGPFTDEQFDEMMQTLAGVSKVLIVNLTVPPRVKDPVAVPNNAVLSEGARRYPNAVLVDWHAASADHPEYFGEDGIHLTQEGAQVYAELIASSLGEDAEDSPALPGPREKISWGEGGTFGECVGPSSWCAALGTP